MAKLTIPPRFREGLSKIRALDQQSVEGIKAALDTAIGASNNPYGAAKAAIESGKFTNVRDFKQIAEALGSLYVAKSREEVTTEEFADDVCDAMEELDVERLRLPHQEREQFREKLLALLRADVFEILSKAWDLRTDDEHTFCGVRILTDLRPVFGFHVEEGPKAMVVVHHLRLGYDIAGNSNKHEDFFVSLDAEDLEQLKNAIKRAESKAKSLKLTVKDIRLLGLSKE